MDGEAISVAFATHYGPNCLKDVIPKYGLHLKVYQALKQVLDTQHVASYQIHYITHADVMPYFHRYLRVVMSVCPPLLALPRLVIRL